jgi:ankyrin repeat protein
MSDNNDCCICLNGLISNDMMITKCNHHIHKSCLTKWLNINCSCPMCRTNLNPNDYDIIIKKNIKVIDIPDNNGITPLMIACKNNNINTVKVLLKLGANITLVDNYNKTAYDYASQHNNYELNNLFNSYA